MKFYKIILRLVTFTVFFYWGCNHKPQEEINSNLYWEDILPKFKQQNIRSIQNDLIRGYYERDKKSGEGLHDDGHAEEVLDSLLNYNESNRALYFFLFNRICLKADGAISEILGKYCMNLMIKDPLYVFKYIENNNTLFDKYASSMGFEFYFKEEGTSDLQYRYSEFREILLKTPLKSEEHSEQLEEFFKEVEKAMESMD